MQILKRRSDAIYLTEMGAFIARRISYSPAGTTIEVALTATESGTRVSVTDQGPGIDEAHRQSITEPFRRLDQRYGGSGLGLSIVQRIVQLHHGYLTLENGAEGGLIASCWLPAKIG